MNRLSRSFLRLILLLLLPLTVGAGDGFIYFNVSVKLIRHPADGLRPRANSSDPTTRITDADIQTAVDDANKFLATYWRGYRLRIVETKEIGGFDERRSNRTRTEPGYYSIQSTKANPLSFSYPPGYTNPLGETPSTGPLIDVLDQNARSTAATKLAFKWNDNAVNIFVPSDWGGGGGIFPEWGDAAGFGFFQGWLFLHELGHYFNLSHTFGDTVTDTAEDPTDAGRDAVAYEIYGIPFASLNATQKLAVDKDSGQNWRALIIYDKWYASLTAAQKQVVDDLPTASDWASILYSKTVSNLTSAEAAEVNRRVANPPFVDRGLYALAVKTYATGYDSLTVAQRTTLRNTYYTRSRNGIAAANGLGNSYAALDDWQKWFVDDVFFNIMSYYDPPERNDHVTRMTEGQADRLTDAVNSSRHHTVSGYTRFVSVTGSNTFGSIPNSGTVSTSPMRTVAVTVARGATQPGDDEIILLRPGNYNEQITIDKPCTLRATRWGEAIIGKP